MDLCINSPQNIWRNQAFASEVIRTVCIFDLHMQRSKHYILARRIANTEFGKTVLIHATLLHKIWMWGYMQLRLYEPICVSNLFMLLHFYMGACSTSLMLKVFPVCNDWSILVLRVVLLVAIVGPAEGIKCEVTMIHDGSNWISYQQLGVIWIIENHSGWCINRCPLQKNITNKHHFKAPFKLNVQAIWRSHMSNDDPPLFFPWVPDRPARWLAQRASDHRGLSWGIPRGSQPTTREPLVKKQSLQTIKQMIVEQMHEKSWNPLNQWYLMCMSTR